jgi:DNA-binding IclR family transcriptional regulator
MDAWRAAVWSLSPGALRSLAFVVATQPPGETFVLSATALADALTMKEERAAEMIDELVAAGWLVEVEEVRERRAGRYLIGPALLDGADRAD